MKQTLSINAAAAMIAVAMHSSGASAHVTLQPKEAAADSYLQMAFTVPHGCDGSATVTLRVKLPPGLLSVKPQMKPGWTVEITTRKLDAPQQTAHGKVLNEVADQIVWRGGPLPDNLYDSFGMIVRLPDSPGQNLYFPVVQECEQGIHRWIEIPAEHEGADKLRDPAPFIRLKDKSP